MVLTDEVVEEVVVDILNDREWVGLGDRLECLKRMKEYEKEKGQKSQSAQDKQYPSAFP